jgi:hypothetical protein
VKQLRDVLRMAARKKNEEPVAVLGEAKDAIGEWHDWEELIAIAGKVLDHGPTCKLIQTLRLMSEERFNKALEITNRMRTRNLALRRQKGGRLMRAQHSPSKVVNAASHIAA